MRIGIPEEDQTLFAFSGHIIQLFLELDSVLNIVARYMPHLGTISQQYINKGTLFQLKHFSRNRHRNK
jgi:hypothetical protein